MMFAGLPVPPDAVEELVGLVRDVGATKLADRLERAVDDEVKLLALTPRRAGANSLGAR